jgi:alpha-beta hydrolase superfamily lysophospholipase
VDPVGGEHGLNRLSNQYIRTGHERVSLKVYEGGRHEMFNEINREEFTADILDWITTSRS